MRAKKSLSESLLETAKPLSLSEIKQSVRKSALEGDRHWDKFTLEALKKDCAFFAREVLTGPNEAPYSGHFILGDHHLEWSELLRTRKRICVLAARSHGKTYFFDFAYPIWKAMQLPNRSGFIFSATQDQAVRILGDIKTEIETNPKLRHLMPELMGGFSGNKWSSAAIQLANGHKIYARGFGTKVRGAHPDWLVVDDALNDETAYSELVRRKQIDYFYTAISNMINPSGQIVVVGTPYHTNDLYGDLSKNSEYTFRRYQALNEKTGKPLWPDRFNLASLKEKKREIGALRFARELQCNPISDDASLFPSHLFQGSPTEVFNLKLGMPKEVYDQLGVTIYIGVDFAMSSSASADYTVIWVMGTDSFGNRWIIDIIREKGLAYQKQLSLINTMGRKYDPALIFLEANQMQRIFGDELIRTTDLPIKKFVTGAEKHTLDKGIPSLRMLLENGKFRIPRGDARSVELTDIWISEMKSFTFVDGKLTSVGGHDDTCFSCWVCDQAIRAGAFSYDFGENLDKVESLDKMLQDENSEETVNRMPIEENSENRLQRILGLPETITKAKGNLVDDMDIAETENKNILVFEDEEEDRVGMDQNGRLLGAPSAAKLRNYW